MSESSLVEREAAVLHALERLAAERARAESETEQGYRLRVETEERGFQEALAKLTRAATTEIGTTEARYRTVQAELNSKFQADRQVLKKEYDEVRGKIATRARTAAKAAKREHEETRWQLLAVFEAAKDSAQKRNKQLEAELTAATDLLRSLKDQADGALQASRRFFPKPAAETLDAAAPSLPPSDQPLVDLEERIKQADERLVPLARLSLPKFLKLHQFVWPFLVVGLAAAYPLGMALGWTIGLVLDGVLVVALAVSCWFWLASIARRQVGRLYPPFRQTLDEADALSIQSQAWVAAAFDRNKAEIEERRAADSKTADEKPARAMAELEARRDLDARQAEEKFPPAIKSLESRHDEALRQIDDRYPRRLAELRERLESDTKKLHENHPP